MRYIVVESKRVVTLPNKEVVELDKGYVVWDTKTNKPYDGHVYTFEKNAILDAKWCNRNEDKMNPNSESIRTS